VALRFVPHARFSIVLVVRNRGGHTLMLTGAHARLPRHSPFHQVGTRLAAYEPPRPVLHTGPGPAPPDFGVDGLTSDLHPEPLQIARGGYAGVQLVFALDDCPRVLHDHASVRAPVALSYLDDGKPRTDSVPNQVAAHLTIPLASECPWHPHSALGIDPPLVETEQELPRSDGDICVRAHGGLAFTSRVVALDADGRRVRLGFALPGFRGPGLYRSLDRPTHDLGPARATLSIGSRRYPARTTRLVVTRIRPHLLRGRLRAEFWTPHLLFTGQGTWACTVR
jgi:hypothetical protein